MARLLDQVCVHKSGYETQGLCQGTGNVPLIVVGTCSLGDLTGQHSTGNGSSVSVFVRALIGEWALHVPVHDMCGPRCMFLGGIAMHAPLLSTLTCTTASRGF